MLTLKGRVLYGLDVLPVKVQISKSVRFSSGISTPKYLMDQICIFRIFRDVQVPL